MDKFLEKNKKDVTSAILESKNQQISILSSQFKAIDTQIQNLKSKSPEELTSELHRIIDSYQLKINALSGDF